MARVKPVWTQENIKKVADLAAKGYQQHQIAEIVGISAYSVGRIAGKHDIDFKRPVNKCDIKTDWGLIRVFNDIFNSKPIVKNKNRMAAY